MIEVIVIGSAVTVTGDGEADFVNVWCDTEELAVDGATMPDDPIECAAVTSLLVDTGDGEDDVRLADVDPGAFGALANVSVDGGAERDTLVGWAGPEDLLGGSGDDLLTESLGDDDIHGGSGNDQLIVDGTDDADDFEVTATQLVEHVSGDANAITGLEFFYFDVGMGANEVDASAGPGTYEMFGDTDSDDLRGGALDDFLDGGDGDDDLAGGAGADTLQGQEGADDLNGGAGDDVLKGGTGDDLLGGGENDDRFELASGDGEDSIAGGGGDDALVIDGSSDELDPDQLTIRSADLTFSGETSGYGGIESIDVRAADGDDDIDAASSSAPVNVTGGAGDDDLTGSSHVDELYGDDGDDAIAAGAGDDLVFGDAGDDTLGGGGDHDFLFGGSDDDSLSGGDGDDAVYGEDGADGLNGDAGSDELDGGEGADLLRGGEGGDTLVLAAGTDELNGQNGSDHYLVTLGAIGDAASAHDSGTAGTDELDLDACGGPGLAISATEASLGADRIQYSGLETYPCGFVPEPVDTRAPETTIHTSPPALTNQTSAGFTFSSDEPGSTFQCARDGVPVPDCVTPLSLTVTEQGLHTFQVQAVDAAGNIDSTPAQRQWTLDTIAPNTFLTGDARPRTNTRDVAFRAEPAEPGTTFRCKLDSLPAAPCVSPVSPSADGPHTIEVRAVDAAGNVDLSPATRAWTLDTTGPVTTIDAPTIAERTATFVFSHAAPDFHAFDCKLDGGAFSSCLSPKEYSSLLPGTHTFAVRARDDLANEGEPKTYTWTIPTPASPSPPVLPPPPPPPVSPPPAPPRKPTVKPKPKLVTLCHKGKTIKVAKAKLKGHLKHKDKLGKCKPKPKKKKR